MTEARAIVRLGPRRGDGAQQSDVHRARSAGPLRLLTPRRAGDAAWIVTSSLGGGLVDGDDVALDVQVDDGATCVLASQASTKVYRGDSKQRTRVTIGDGAAAIVVPDPIVPFRDSVIVQSTTIAMHEHASLVLCDAITAGRIAHGERWGARSIDSRIEMTASAIAGSRESSALEPSSSSNVLRSDTSAASVHLRDRVLIERPLPVEAIATMIVLGPRVRREARALLDDIARRSIVERIAASEFRDGAIVKLAGTITEVTSAIRLHLTPACRALGEDPWARKW